MNSLYPIIAIIVVLSSLIILSIGCKLMFKRAVKPIKKNHKPAVVNTKLMR